MQTKLFLYPANSNLLTKLNINILGIETSCDETSIAIISASNNKTKKTTDPTENYSAKLLAHQIYSQIKEHQPYGGVVPEIAARSHLEIIDHLTLKALQEAGLGFADLSAVAATTGPGLIGGVIIGTMAGKTIASSCNIPFISVNHLEAHALSGRMAAKLRNNHLPFPFLLLLVSGGHSMIILAHNIAQYEVLGKTIDDSAGEAFDKVARMLGLGYPGGPAVERAAHNGQPDSYQLPLPRSQHKKDADFSFSGLKTAVRNLIAKESTQENTQHNNHLPQTTIANICASFQEVVANSLYQRLDYATAQAKQRYPQLSHIVIAGGVAANKSIGTKIKKLSEQYQLQLIIPESKFCTDNGAMIAWTGLEYFARNISHPLSTEPKARWPLNEL